MGHSHVTPYVVLLGHYLPHPRLSQRIFVLGLMEMIGIVFQFLVPKAWDRTFVDSGSLPVPNATEGSADVDKINSSVSYKSLSPKKLKSTSRTLHVVLPVGDPG